MAESLQAAFRYLFPAEVTALKDLARMLPSNPVVVNLGAGAGTSGLAFAESREDLKLYTVDIQDESSPFGCLQAERDILRQAGFDIDSPGSRFTQVLSHSMTLGKAWSLPLGQSFGNGLYGWGKNLIDMAFIDGDHSYKGCKGDILAWLPNIKPGGIMAVHDFNKKEVYKRTDLPEAIPHPLPWPGVDRAVRKFLCPFYEIALHIDTLIAFRIK